MSVDTVIYFYVLMQHLPQISNKQFHISFGYFELIRLYVCTYTYTTRYLVYN